MEDKTFIPDATYKNIGTATHPIWEEVLQDPIGETIDLANKVASKLKMMTDGLNALLELKKSAAKEKEPDYVVVSMKNTATGTIDKIENRPVPPSWYSDDKNWVMNSIRRKSDGQLFTLGDVVFSAAQGEGFSFEIEKFDTISDTIYICSCPLIRLMRYTSPIKLSINEIRDIIDSISTVGTDKMNLIAAITEASKNKK